jgi:hypothetical protein
MGAVLARKGMAVAMALPKTLLIAKNGPVVTIAIFFLLSALHFGEEGPFPMAAVEGGMVIWVPFLARPEEAPYLQLATPRPPK